MTRQPDRDLPLVKGGQGRSGEEVEDAGMNVLWALLALSVFAVCAAVSIATRKPLESVVFLAFTWYIAARLMRFVYRGH